MQPFYLSCFDQDPSAFVCVLIPEICLTKCFFWVKISVFSSMRWFGLSSLIGNDIKLSGTSSSIWSNQTLQDLKQISKRYSFYFKKLNDYDKILSFKKTAIKRILARLHLDTQWYTDTGVDKHLKRFSWGIYLSDTYQII